MATVTRVSGYEVVRDLPADRIAGRYTELIHERSGLRHIHIAYPEEKSACYIVVRTRSEDDTGVPHVLEHMCFQGSRRFSHAALKDHTKLPGGRSASTSHDYTQYNFNSRNPAAWHGLFAVSLDSVFQPLLEEESFWEEAWRHEFATADDPSSELLITGRVYNEMKGTSVNDFYHLWEAAGAALYPDSIYAHNAGADLEAIQTLTWEATRAYHARYYNPANVVMVTAGTMPLEAILETVEASGVNEIPRRGAEPDVTYPHLDHPSRRDIPKASDDPESGQAAVAWAMHSEVTDALAFRAAALLCEALLGTADAPLRQALADAGLGTAPADAPRFLDTYPHPGILAGVKGIRIEDSERLETVLLEALDTLSRGIPRAHLERALDTMEVDLHDRGEASYLGLVDWPFSLRLCMPAFRAAISGADAHRAIDWGSDLEELRRRAQRGGFFEELVRTDLLGNQHRALVRLVPEPGLADRSAQAGTERLRAVARSLGERGAREIAERSARLAARERAPAEELPIAPVDSRAQPPQVAPGPLEVDTLDGSTVSIYGFESTGLLHTDVRVDAGGLDAAKCDLLPLLARVLARIGGRGIESRVDVEQRADGTPGLWLTVGGKTLTRHADTFIAGIESAIATRKFEPAVVASVIEELLGEADKTLVYTWSAPQLALSLAAAGLDDANALRERLAGTSQMPTLRSLVPEAAAAALAVLAGELIGRGRAHCFAAAHQGIAEKTRVRLQKLLRDLPAARPPGPLPTGLTGDFPEPGEARSTSATQAFNALAYATVPYTHQDAAALTVAGLMFTLGTELQAISKERGAYGASGLADADHGLFGFSSWYDPHVTLTYDTFEAVVRRAVEAPPDAEELGRVAGIALSSLAPHLAPDALARRDWSNRLRGITPEDRAQYRERVLGLTPAGLTQAVATHLRSPRRATLGAASLIQQAGAERPGFFARVLAAG